MHTHPHTSQRTEHFAKWTNVDLCREEVKSLFGLKFPFKYLIRNICVCVRGASLEGSLEHMHAMENKLFCHKGNCEAYLICLNYNIL
jgi:hypothetical protein